jgi:hypothetical protein
MQKHSALLYAFFHNYIFIGQRQNQTRPHACHVRFVALEMAEFRSHKWTESSASKMFFFSAVQPCASERSQIAKHQTYLETIQRPRPLRKDFRYRNAKMRNTKSSLLHADIRIW